MIRTPRIIALFLLAAMLSACGGNENAAKTGDVRAAPPAMPTVTIATVTSGEINRQLRLPGELLAYQDVMLYPKVQGFIEWIGVDRGSAVRAGQLLVRLSAPEIGSQRSEAMARTGSAAAQRLEAEARVGSIRAQRLEAEAKLAAASATYQRLKSASATPGVVSGNELENAQRIVEAEQARVQVYRDNEKAAQAQVQALAENEAATRAAVKSAEATENYLRIVAPFDGVITERNAHQGSLVGPASAGAAMPLLRLQQVSRLRLVIAVPEMEIAAIKNGAKVDFTVPAFPGDKFSGTIARIGDAVDANTRTMPVELDVQNQTRGVRRLAPGMFPQVLWPSKRLQPSLLVPPSAVAVTTERSFVIRIRDGLTEWVDVKRGASINQQGSDLVEIFGDLSPGDQIALRGTDELRAGTRVQIKSAAPQGK